MQFKVKKSYIIITLIMMIFTKPTFVDVIPQLSIVNLLYDGCRVLLMASIPIYYFFKRYHSSHTIILIAIYGVLIGSTYYNKGDIRSVILTSGTIFSCSMIAEIFAIEKPTVLLKAIKNLFLLYITLNAITLLLFPEGWFISGEVNVDNWFLGNKNLFVLFHLPYLFSVYELAAYEKKRLKPIDCFGISITVICTFISGSATGIMGIAVFFIIYYFKAVLKKAITARIGFIVSYVLFVLIVIMNLAKLFSFLIVTVLHRNLTLTVRTYVWEYALKWFKSSPMYGVGIQTADIAKDHMFRYYHPHCTYLYYLVFAGIIGFVLYTIYLVFVSNRIDSLQNETAIPCVAIFWSILITYITEVYSRPELFFMIFAIAVCLSNAQGTVVKGAKKKRRLFRRVRL